MKYDNLTVACLTPEQRQRTCRYWYTVQSRGMALTAFRTREALNSWLMALGLTLERPLPIATGMHDYIKIIGCYRRELCFCEQKDFESLPGLPVVVLENGKFVTGKLNEDENGRIVMVPNPNCKWAIEHDYRLCAKLEDAGLTIL